MRTIYDNNKINMDLQHIKKKAGSANITVLYDTDENRIQVAEHGSHEEKQKPCLDTRC